VRDDRPTMPPSPDEAAALARFEHDTHARGEYTARLTRIRGFVMRILEGDTHNEFADRRETA
jgi:hypothetical protein